MSGKQIWAGDYSEEGYTDGINASEKHQPKNKLSFLKEVHPINLAWQFDNAIGSYSDSYDKGYVDGQRKLNNVHYRSEGELNHMTITNNNYELQLKVLGEFERHLDVLKTYLNEVPERYGQQIKTTASLGFVEDYVDGLSKRQKEFTRKIAQTISLIDQQKGRIESAHKAEISRLKQVAQQ